MKLIIASDIHGSAKWCKLLLDAYRKEGAEKLLLLGDILYHGPRNPLPDDYNPMRVVELLTEIKDEILCVQGNCDAEVDKMVLPFRVNSVFAFTFVDGRTFVLFHGDKDFHRPIPNEIYLTGHTHVPMKEVGERIHLNPGSTSLPKEGSPHSYILYDNGKFLFKNLETGETYDELDIMMS